jgi:hypothetical protein
VWNLAPEICITFAVALALAGRPRRGEPVPVLLRLAVAPVFVLLLVGSLRGHAAVTDYLLKPQHDIMRVDAALPATDPSLKQLLNARVKPGERVAYLAAGPDPVLSPHLYEGTVQPNGAPLWLPLVPFSAINILNPSRRTVYLDRFINSHPEGGWLIERTGSQPEELWVKLELEKRFRPGPTYSNAQYVLTFWSLNRSG